MSVTVVICAYTLDRWDQLAMAIDSVRAQRPLHETILVVDHNEDLFERSRDRWPEVIVVENAGPRGLSAGRNTALEIATGSVVAFLDDDAVADPGWLETLVAPFSDAAVVAVGGSAVPIWPDSAPAVIPDELLWIVGCSYLGLPEAPGPIRNVMGCSMAFRRAPLMSVGGFNPDTGRVGRLPIGCEETEVCIQLRQADPSRVVHYAPSARVRHHVSADRVRMRYVLHRSWCEGLSKAAISRTVGRRDALATESTYATRVLPAGVWRELKRGPRGLPAASAIVVSAGAAAAGYARGRFATVRTGAARAPLSERVST
ncbi:Glycosyltransferase, GT2 family [Microbacterium sp. cf046]|uniref:glycosyltransferase family 2 protein n=1 Tax=Microbacterium sp. cf046 TaxID=1761803 RepID=UPI0008E2F206|nr:glycosyltransferase [Microbacterium sp. cf046]SFS00743.1 Glycosyltransferase, GT2 family [Microbacterium sp. cf046]